MYAINLNNENRILRATEERFKDEESILVEFLPEGDLSDYLYINGEYIFNENPEKEKARKQAEISQLKNNLSQTDYIMAKAMEKLIDVNDPEQIPQIINDYAIEYKNEIIERKQWRARIEELEPEDV